MSSHDSLTGAAAPPTRAVRGRPRLPQRRAVVGALLVTTAAAMAFGLSAGADHAPQHHVLVARTSVRAGQRLTAADVRVESMHLAPGSLGNTFADPAEIDGAVALAGLEADEIVQGSAVLRGSAPDSRPDDLQFSLPVERVRALDGDLAPGETVDVLATYGTGESAYTTVIARRALLIHTAETSSGLGSDERLIITLGLHDAGEVMAATHASVAGTVTLVRTTGVDGEVGPDTYTPRNASER